MPNKFLRFQRLRELAATGMDGHRYQLDFEVGEKRGEAFQVHETRSVELEVSGTLQAIWGKSDAQLPAYAGTSALPSVLALAKNHQLEMESGPIRLNTYTASKDPPREPLMQPGDVIALSESTPQVPPSKWSFLSEDISAVRDEINALSKAVWKDRLLLLSQERPLLDMYKSARDAEEFRARVQSLGVIAKDMNRELLRRVAGEQRSDAGEFVLLGKALAQFANQQVIDSICIPLKQINNLRQGYPTHGDNTDKFLGAHKYFGLSYPITDHASSWERVLAEYFKSMKALRESLSAAWSV